MCVVRWLDEANNNEHDFLIGRYKTSQDLLRIRSWRITKNLLVFVIQMKNKCDGSRAKIWPCSRCRHDPFIEKNRSFMNTIFASNTGTSQRAFPLSAFRHGWFILSWRAANSYSSIRTTVTCNPHSAGLTYAGGTAKGSGRLSLWPFHLRKNGKTAADIG